MPSKKKKLIRERMAKTGESWATAAQNISPKARIKHGRYSGTPVLPDGAVTEHFDGEGRHLPEVRFPQVDLVNIQGDFDPEDLWKAWVPSTAFDDPKMPRQPDWPADTKRVLTLAEFIEARAKQMGWKLESVRPHGPPFMGQIPMVRVTWGPGEEGEG